MKKHVGYNVAIAVCGVLAVVFLVLLVLAILPPAKKLGIEVKDTVGVSSSGLDGGYVVQIAGSIVNLNEETVTADEVRILVSDGRNDKTVVLKDVKLSPRVPYDLLWDWKDTTPYDRVKEVTVVVDGTSESLSNNTQGLVLNLNTLLWGVLTVMDAIVLIYLAKQRYYLYQEDKMKQEN